ncbi:MAG: OsmC family protein [Myxococcota bacterium]|nr:OsmC family protein [Myxococcota bacterium]
MRMAKVTTASGKFGQKVQIGAHVLAADEPLETGGDDIGPAPHEWILAGLGACTSMTLRAYAAHKGWPLESVEVIVEGHHRDGEFILTRHVRVSGTFTVEQRTRLLEIANKCPVHKSLSGTIRIETDLT